MVAPYKQIIGEAANTIPMQFMYCQQYHKTMLLIILLSNQFALHFEFANIAAIQSFVNLQKLPS